jgi:hypothetical protein
MLSGCGEPGLKGLYPVKGKITHNGVPLAEVGVSLAPVNAEPGARRANAISAADGTFSLRTLKPDDGAFPGEYKITLTKLVFSMSREEMLEMDAKGRPFNTTSTNIIPPQDWTFTVKKGKNDPLIIDITGDLIVPNYKWYKEALKKQK